MIAKFVRLRLSRDEDRGFRSHLTSCEECAGIYRATLASAARLGRSIREERSELDREQRHTEFKERAINATGDRPRRNRFGLRLALLPAGVALALILFRAGGGTDSLSVHWTGGEVRVAGERLGTDQRTIRLSRGDYCETRGNATAVITSSDDEEDVAFELGTDTVVLVIDTKERDVRLQKGELFLNGPCTVSSAHGVLQVEHGSARLDVRGGLYDLECLEGELLWTGPTGERRLLPGEAIESSSVLVDAR